MLTPELVDIYLRGVADGLARAKTEEKPYLDHADIMARYGVGENKARDIIYAIRRYCDGGLLNCTSKVLLSEAIAWESNPIIKFKERL